VHYAKCTGRTVPLGRCEKTPKEGEIILSVFKTPRRTQISVHPKFLFSWQPVVGDEVVVIKGLLFGTAGFAKEERDGNQWLVSFSVDGHSGDFVFHERDLAMIE
jgi:hypothetical protein